jgi:hypothetical protein
MAPDRQREKLAADLELAMRGGQRGTRLGQPRLGLGHVGAGILADLEAVAGGAQLLGHDADVRLAHVHHLQVAPDVQVGRDRVQQHLLFDRHEALPRGQNGLARRLDPQAAAVAGIEHPFRHETRGAVVVSATRSRFAEATKDSVGRSRATACATPSSSMRRRKRFCSRSAELT